MRALFRLGVMLGSPALVGLTLAGCWREEPPPPAPPPVVQIPTPGHGIGIYKVGQPYQMNGAWYYPTPDLAYDENGIGTQYGPDFHEAYTSNGEVFDQALVTGAHKTLPLPAIVQVTNLDNGRSIQVRVNDRGPYAPGRIIELSRRAAQLLAFDESGTAKLRVRLLVPETLQAQSLAKLNGSDTAGMAPEIVPKAAPREAVTAQALPPPNAAQSSPSTAPPPVRVSAQSFADPAATGKPVPPGPPLSNTIIVFPVAPTRIFIEVEAYQGNVGSTRTKLAKIGPVQVTPVRANGMSSFRVRLGPIPTVAQADAMLAQAVEAAAQARIVVE